MENGLYSDEQLFVIGKTNYERLALHCQTLEVSGFWEQARKVMQQSSTEVLDMYVQSVLMELAVHCGSVTGSQLTFVQTVPISNPLGITDETELNAEMKKDIDRIYNLPPVLIQLCSLYDKQNGDDITEYFIDALLNILLCMACLNGGKSGKVNEFIQKYYQKISYFVLERSPAEHSRYLARKLQGDSIECDVEKKTPPAFEWYDLAEEKDGTGESGDKAAGKEVPDVLGTGTAETGQELAEETAGNPDGSFYGEDREEEPDAWESEEEEEIEEEFEETEEKGEPDFAEEEQDVATDDAEPGNTVTVAASGTQQQELIREKTKEEQEAELSEQARAQFLLVKKRIKDREQAEQKEHERRIQEIMDELNGLVGLDNVKQEIQSLINLIKIRKLREKMHLPEMDMSYHMVFTGSPGTGKTTVARLVAKIYKELGILSEGNLVETDRSGLVAGYVGQTAIKVHEIVEQAIGGILFIDEAYALANPDIQNDFGTEAVDTLVKLMEDNRDNLVIIVAGYTEEMQTFLKSNTGLVSRFNKFIDFPDYSKEELVEIMGVMAENAGLTIEETARDRVYELMEKKSPQEWETFGNARGIRNMFEKFIMNQANRLVMVDSPSVEELTLIKEEDVCV